MVSTKDWRSVIVIVGAGFSGTMTAVNLLRKQWSRPVLINLIERNEQIGLGVAYGTTHDWHYLNVHAANMSALADDTDDLGNFLQNQPEDKWWRTYVQRKQYGKYLQSRLAAAQAEAESRGHTLNLVHGSVSSLTKRADGKIECRLSDDTTIEAAYVVLALGNASPSVPGRLSTDLEGDDRLIVDPWQRDWNGRMKKTDAILFLGTGLTMIDKALELAAGGHEGNMVAVSRHGLLPHPHKPELLERKSSQIPIPFSATTALEALRSIRSFIRQGPFEDWRQAIDCLRPHTKDWWQSLSLVERKRFLRHLQCYWDVHRHRMAPEVAAHIYDLMFTEKLRIVAGRVVSCARTADQLKVSINERHACAESETFMNVDWIINCTGAETRLEKSPHALLSSLWSQGLVRANELGMGLEVTPSYNLVAKDGAVDHQMFAIGPPLRGTFFETIAVPELRHQASSVANSIRDLVESALTKNPSE